MWQCMHYNFFLTFDGKKTEGEKKIDLFRFSEGKAAYKYKLLVTDLFIIHKVSQ